MHASQIITIAFAVGATAKSTSTSSLFVPAAAGADVTASVVAAGAKATTYELEWQPTGADESLAYDEPTITATLTQGPSTVAFHLTDADWVTWDYVCAIGGQQSSCSQMMSTPGLVYQGGGASAYTEYLVPATITAGVELLTSATATSASATASASSSNGQEGHDGTSQDGQDGITSSTGTIGGVSIGQDGQDAQSTTSSANGADSSQTVTTTGGQGGSGGQGGEGGSVSVSSSGSSSSTSSTSSSTDDEDSAAGRAGQDALVVGLAAMAGVMMVML